MPYMRKINISSVMERNRIGALSKKTVDQEEMGGGIHWVLHLQHMPLSCLLFHKGLLELERNEDLNIVRLKRYSFQFPFRNKLSSEDHSSLLAMHRKYAIMHPSKRSLSLSSTEV